MTTPERLDALCKATQHVIEAKVPGAIVECGVWKGGSMMAAALTLNRLGIRDRDLYLFDTFEGLPEPGPEDVSERGKSAVEEWRELDGKRPIGEWCLATLEEVKANIELAGYDPDRVHYVKGKVEETVPSEAPDQIALLRLDTDWYESTRHEMEHLYPRLSRGGVLIIDDYGWWRGARKAVDEYLHANDIRLLLHRVDRSCRLAVK